MLPTEGEELTRYVLSARLEPGADVGAAMERLSSQLPEVKVVEIDTFLEQILGPLASAVTRVAVAATARSEEHTSELQSRGHLVCRLLLENKKRVKSTR